MSEINMEMQHRLIRLSKALINQEKAKILIPAKEEKSGYWFGGGNIVKNSAGNVYISGRYRNKGDSRTGTGVGVRGFELDIFKAHNDSTFPGGFSTSGFSIVKRFSKKDLSYGDYRVISIEGSDLHFTREGVELYVSTEKEGIPYPEELKSFKKPGTGVWTIDVIRADSVENLDASNIQPLIQSQDSRFLHVKDPIVYDSSKGDTVLIFCTHPFNWSCSNSAFAVRKAKDNSFVYSAGYSIGPSYGKPNFEFFPRGYTWDVAMSRITDVFRVPELGSFAGMPKICLYFYDGGESVRSYTEHEKAVKRPRGYSCEEIGGLAFSAEADFPKLKRLSVNLPFFVSPYGTGSSRYVKTLNTEEGIFAVWQQSQEDLSQPLVYNFLPAREVEKILA